MRPLRLLAAGRTSGDGTGWETKTVQTLAATPVGREALAAITRYPAGCLAAFDFDGTLAPIVEDPSQAQAHPHAAAALAALAQHVGTVAVVTGRPAQVAVDLGGFADVAGLSGLLVVGHYGLESWDASTGELRSVEPSPGLDSVRATLPGLLAGLGVAEAVIEDKVLSVAVHVRSLDRPDAAFATILGPLKALAEQHGLVAEPGRLVVELRSAGMDKGQALVALVEERAARSVMFTGDDLGDLAAFTAVERLRDTGIPGLLVCSGSPEVDALAERADVVVDGPGGVIDFVWALVDVLTSGQNDPTPGLP